MTEEQFKTKNGIYGTYSIDENGLCNVEGDVDLNGQDLTEIPIPFGAITGSFLCGYNHLKSLKNAPKHVGDDFYCNNNFLTTLEYAPTIVGGNFRCHNNHLTTLEFAPEYVGDDFWCAKNKLNSLEYAPNYVGGYFYCENNSMKFTEQEVRKVCKVVGRVVV